MPIKINLGTVTFLDKLTIILLECICYFLIKRMDRTVWVEHLAEKNILTEEILVSPLRFLKKGKSYSRASFLRTFNFLIGRNHYRRYMKYEDIVNTNRLSLLFSDIVSFQIHLGVDEETASQIAEVLIELVGNACEHACTDCLIDIDIPLNYSKKGNDGDFFGNFYGINISIVNYSEKLFFQDLQSKILMFIDDGSKLTNDRYKTLVEAYQNHKSQFSEDYTEDDFFTIAAFQYKISGRINNNSTGGTGLKKLIQGLQNKSDACVCYMQTGNRVFCFSGEYLEYDDGNWIGFNKENDFLNNIPDKRLFHNSKVYVPGTAYNLSFVYEKKEN